MTSKIEVLQNDTISEISEWKKKIIMHNGMLFINISSFV